MAKAMRKEPPRLSLFTIALVLALRFHTGARPAVAIFPHLILHSLNVPAVGLPKAALGKGIVCSMM